MVVVIPDSLDSSSSAAGVCHLILPDSRHRAEAFVAVPCSGPTVRPASHRPPHSSDGQRRATAPAIVFVHLTGDRALIESRPTRRPGPLMPTDPRGSPPP